MKALTKTLNNCLIGGLAVVAMLSGSMVLAQTPPAQNQYQSQMQQQKYRGQAVNKAQRAPMTDAEKAQIKAKILEKTQAKLNDWERELNITQAQQSQWNAYATAIKNMKVSKYKLTRPDYNADAATLAQYEAQKAANQAEVLADVSDATAKLQAILTPEQQTKFTNIVRSKVFDGKKPPKNIKYKKGDKKQK